MKLKFNNKNIFYTLDSYGWQPHIVTIKSSEITEVNLSGFNIYLDDEETIIEHYEEYKHFYSTHTPLDYCMSYTDIEGNEETESQVIDMSGLSEAVEIVVPLSNQELTECVAELMYETSLMQLGMEV